VFGCLFWYILDLGWTRGRQSRWASFRLDSRGIGPENLIYLGYLKQMNFFLLSVLFNI
jgi:hypothetical protein